MVVADRNRASSLISVSFLFLFFSVMRLCVTGPPVFLIFFLNFFFLMCRCMSWGFKNFKAGLLMQSMPTSGILRERKRLHVVRIPQGTEKKNWRLLKCRFEVIFFNIFFGFCNIIVKN